MYAIRIDASAVDSFAGLGHSKLGKWPGARRCHRARWQHTLVPNCQPLIGMWIKLLTVPYRFLFPAIVVFCSIGCYTLNNNAFDVYMTASFTMVGYIFYKLGCEPAPLLLGFILGPMMEENLRRALLLSRGDWTTFATRPLSAGLLVAATLMIVVVMLPSIKAKREEAFHDEE